MERQLLNCATRKQNQWTKQVAREKRSRLSTKSSSSGTRRCDEGSARRLSLHRSGRMHLRRLETNGQTPLCVRRPRVVANIVDGWIADRLSEQVNLCRFHAWQQRDADAAVECAANRRRERRTSGRSSERAWEGGRKTPYWRRSPNPVFFAATCHLHRSDGIGIGVATKSRFWDRQPPSTITKLVVGNSGKYRGLPQSRLQSGPSDGSQRMLLLLLLRFESANTTKESTRNVRNASFTKRNER